MRKILLAVSFLATLGSTSALALDWDPSACVDYVCKRLSSFECSDSREVQDVVLACQNNYGTECIETVLSYLNPFDYNERREMVEIVNACKFNWGGVCVNSVCSRISSFNCNERHELVQIATSCQDYSW